MNRQQVLPIPDQRDGEAPAEPRLLNNVPHKREGEAPAEPKIVGNTRFGRSLALLFFHTRFPRPGSRLKNKTRSRFTTFRYSSTRRHEAPRNHDERSFQSG